jgi:phenylacetate-CoA ligase
MPLIRYLIGDAAKLSSTGCDCGRASPVIESIEGRMDDLIRTPSGRQVGRLDPAFKGINGVRESQIVQTALDQVVVRIVADDLSAFDSYGLIANLSERLGTDVNVSIEYVNSIPREANGKFRSVKSLIPPSHT